MNQSWIIAVKDLRLLYRDKVGLFFIIAFPIGMGLLFGSITTFSSGGSSSTGFKIAIVDEDETDVSKKFIETLGKREELKLVPTDRESARNDVRRGRLVAMLVLTKGFGESAGAVWKEPPTIELAIDPSRSAEGAMINGFIMESMGTLMFDRFQDPDLMRSMVQESRTSIKQSTDMPPLLKAVMLTMFTSLDSFFDELKKSQENAAKDEADGAESGIDQSPFGRGFQLAKVESVSLAREVDPNSPRGVAQRLRSRWDISFPQASIWGIMACCAGFAASIVRERTHGTLLRLQVSPATDLHVLGGKSMACGLSVILVLTMMVTLGCFLGMRPKSWAFLLLAAVSIAACFVGIMMLMSVIGKTEEAVAGAGWSVNMVMAMFGGGMIPLAFMPAWMVTVSHFSPVKWSILAMEGAIWREFSLTEMLLPCGVLWGVGVVALFGGLTLGKSRLKLA